MQRPDMSLEIIRASCGVADLLMPDPVAEQFFGHPSDPRERDFIRILGGRKLAKARIFLAWNGRTAHRLGSAVDPDHVATTVAAPVKNSRRKMAGTVNAALSTLLSCGELR